MLRSQGYSAPGRLAVQSYSNDGPTGAVTYGELHSSAVRLGRHLAGMGVEAGARCAVVCYRSVEMVLGIMGTLKANAAYVPVDPAYPKDRIAYMVEDTQSKAPWTT